MAVSIPADIVLDVARAADPARYHAAVERLQTGTGFSDVARDVALGYSAMDDGAAQARRAFSGMRMPFDVEAARVRLSMGGRDVDPALLGYREDGLAHVNRARAKDTYEQFEALALQKFIESMLPQKAETYYGGGFAGGVWKSLLAQQVALELARSGGIGIARSVEKAHPSGLDQRADGNARPAALQDLAASASVVG